MNAFTNTTGPSLFTAKGNRRHFINDQHYPRNMQPIRLPGSSKNPPPPLMKKPK